MRDVRVRRLLHIGRVLRELLGCRLVVGEEQLVRDVAPADRLRVVGRD